MFVINKLKKRKILIVVFAIYLFSSCTQNREHAENLLEKGEEPKIVNIINFIRLCEPRDSRITEEVLYETVVSQVEMMRKYKLRGTFLLQYDALMDSRYQKLMQSLPKDSFEIGAWWEIPQPLVENAGLEWRGRYPWDWHADVGFSTGYVPEERERLADVYMADFKNIFGYYPESVASWFIDAHTLNYLYQKYHIVASANCKDQYGTDGYTMWGGYWNQAYYPSKVNSYMPAQNEENQIPVPIFRMLGSDPIRQYDQGLGSDRQGVVSLEPVYKDGGGNADWVNWYFREFINGESMEYAYVQVGQENSFTWDAMVQGFNIQLPLIAKLRDDKSIRLETLAESGKWFKGRYNTTPATSVTVTRDLDGSNRKTVWFNSRYYRLNLFWEDGTLRFRDIHLFDENIPSAYLDKRVDSNECTFFTLPLVDGYLWSKPNEFAGLWFKAMVNEEETFLKGLDPVVTNPSEGKLLIVWPLENVQGTLEIAIDEHKVHIILNGDEDLNWYVDLTTARDIELPFKNADTSRMNCEYLGTKYSISLEKGAFSKPDDETIFRMSPKNNLIVMELKTED